RRRGAGRRPGRRGREDLVVGPRRPPAGEGRAVTDPLQAGLALVYGMVSALVPVVNAEAYALVLSGRAHPALAVAVVVALAVGQTIGKLVLFEPSRRGSGALARRFATRHEGRTARWGDRIRDCLGSRRTGL